MNGFRNKNIKIAVVATLFLLFLPLVSGAQIIPCGGYDSSGARQPECDYYHFIQLVKNVINWIILFSFPVSAFVFAWAGFKYMTTGISDQKSAAKSMLVKVFIGFVIILASWLIVNTVLDALLDDGFRQAVPLSK